MKNQNKILSVAHKIAKTLEGDHGPVHAGNTLVMSNKNNSKGSYFTRAQVRRIIEQKFRDKYNC